MVGIIAKFIERVFHEQKVFVIVNTTYNNVMKAYDNAFSARMDLHHYTENGIVCELREMHRKELFKKYPMMQVRSMSFF